MRCARLVNTLFPRLLLLCGLGCGFCAQASDWPQFLGPIRNGVYAGADLAAAWPKDGPAVVWRRPVGKGFSGPACSPLVEGNAVLMIIGGKAGFGIAAFDKATGKVLWKATDDEAGYASPVAATLHGRRTALLLTRSELVASDPVTGNIFFRFPFEPPIHSSVTAATPLVMDDKIFLSASYDTGAVLLKVNSDIKGVEKIWAGEDILSNHYATSVYHDGFLYGLHGRTDPGMETPTLRCVEVNTGKVRWKKDFAAATIT